MLAIIAVVIIVSIVTLLMMGKISPVIAMSGIPVLGFIFAIILMPELAFINGDFTNLEALSIAKEELSNASFSEIVVAMAQQISSYSMSGIIKVAPVGVMFLFAIVFFSIMKDLHIFDPVIRSMIKITKGNVIVVCIATAAVAAIVHLDGSGAATFLIIIPAFLPLYRQLGMSPYLMLLLMCVSMGIMNMVPWGGPLGRAASVTSIDVAQLWRPLILVQIIGVLGSLCFAAIMGIRENRRIAKAKLIGTTPYAMDSLFEDNDDVQDSVIHHKPIRPVINALLIIITIICLALGLLPPAVIFMIMVSLALLINYPSAKLQMKVFEDYAPQAIGMVSIIFAAGVFLGILDNSGMLKAIAMSIITVMPTSWIVKLHIFIGLIGVPMDLFSSTDAYYFALLPIVLEVTGTMGVEPSSIVYSMTIGNNAGTFVSPFSPAAWLAMGLAGTDMGRHLRYSFGWIWLFSLFPLAVGAMLGLY